MGKVKEEWMNSQEEALYEWIADNYGADAGEEGSDAWNEAVQDFENYCEEQGRLADEAREQDEYNYYLSINPKDAYSILSRDLAELKLILDTLPHGLPTPTTVCKMIYAHAVTILEVYLEDMIKTLIMSDDKYLVNTINNVRPFSDTRFKLSELSLDDGGIKKFVLGKLSDCCSASKIDPLEG